MRPQMQQMKCSLHDHEWVEFIQDGRTVFYGAPCCAHGKIVHTFVREGLSMNEAVAFLGVHRNTFADYVAKGKVQAIEMPDKQRRYDPAEIEALATRLPRARRMDEKQRRLRMAVREALGNA